MTKEHIKINIGELKPHPKNPKEHNHELIKSSISELGFVDDIVIDENNIILSGHGRLRAMTELGNDRIDCIRITGWTEDQKERFLILSNKSVESGGWSVDLLKQFDKELLMSAGFDRDDLMFDLSDDASKIDGGNLEVLTVVPPETYKLKEKSGFCFDNIEDYIKVKEFFGNEKTLDVNKLLSLIK